MSRGRPKLDDVALTRSKELVRVTAKPGPQMIGDVGAPVCALKPERVRRSRRCQMERVGVVQLMLAELTLEPICLFAIPAFRGPVCQEFRVIRVHVSHDGAFPASRCSPSTSRIVLKPRAT